MKLFLRLTAALLAAICSASAQNYVTGQIAASQVTSGTFTISLFPVGSTASTVALGSDVRFLNATSLNGTSITSLTGILKLTGGTPSNAAAADIGILFGCTAGLPILSYNGTTASCLAASGGGSVTVVNVTAPATLFSAAGSGYTTNGTVAFSFATGQTASQVYGTSAAGAAGLLALTSAHLPPINLASTANGGVTGALPNASVAGLAASATTDATNAANITTGSLPAARLPTSTEVWNTYAIPFGSINAAATTQAVTVVALVARGLVCGLVEKTTTAFAGPSITGLTTTIGDSNGTAITYSQVAYNLLATVSNTNAIVNNVTGLASFLGGNIQLNVTATGANLSALTAGVLSVSVCTSTLP